MATTIATMLLVPLSASAAVVPRSGGLVATKLYQVKLGESLIEIARKFDLGYNAIVDANPLVDPFIPKAGAAITIPTRWILPTAASGPAILINIPEYRLYYLPKRNRGKIFTFPLGIGDEGSDTPVGRYHVVEKITKPAWHVPKSIRALSPKYPRLVPPGPDNPMGSHALRLSMKSILIHGTNRPWGIGRRSSHGCLRLYPEDIVSLFNMVPKGMTVVIVNQPLKVAKVGGRVYVEVHRYQGRQPTVGDAMQMLADRHWLSGADFRKLIAAVGEKRGYPVDVSLEMEKSPAKQQPRMTERGRLNIWQLIMNRVFP
jgi:L,D-transpeptidase ErfK/SrfK